VSSRILSESRGPVALSWPDWRQRSEVVGVDRGQHVAEQFDRPTSSTKRETTVPLERAPFHVRPCRARPILLVTCHQDVPEVSAKGRACLVLAKRSSRRPVPRQRRSDARGLGFRSLLDDCVVTWGTVLKTGRRASVSWVRIPPRPPFGKSRFLQQY
jgi:hypothetical protein